MRFGDHIRELRQDRRWTQPDAASRIGIEQSYLSKLESGRSYPSEEVFASLVEVYDLDPLNLTDKLFPAELDRLREISLVRASLLERERSTEKQARSWLLAGICLMAIGGGALGLALLGQEKVVELFKYKSEGVVVEAEATDGAGGEDYQSIQPAELLYRDIEDYKDVVFYEDAPEGRRIWRFYGAATDVRPSPLRWFLVPSLMAIFGAFGCFFASYRAR